MSLLRSNFETSTFVISIKYADSRGIPRCANVEMRMRRSGWSGEKQDDEGFSD